MIPLSFDAIWSNKIKKVPIIFTIASTIKDTGSDCVFLKVEKL